MPLLTKERLLDIDKTKTNNSIHFSTEYDILDIMQLNNNSDISKDMIDKYLINCSSDLKSNYKTCLNWIKNNPFSNTSFSHIPIILKNPKLLIFVNMLYDGFLHKMITCKDNSFIIILLSNIFLSESNVYSDSDKHLELPPEVSNYIYKYNKEVPSENMILNCVNSVSNLVMSFYKNGTFNQKNKDIIGVFQRQFYTLLQLLNPLAKEGDLLIKNLNHIDSILWNKCQTSGIKV